MDEGNNGLRDMFIESRQMSRFLGEMDANFGSSSIRWDEIDREDKKKHVKVTWSRILANYLSEKLLIYYPNRKNEGETKASLSHAWTFFEHMSLPRYRLANNSAHDKSEKGKIRSFPGEEETALYPIFGTSEHDLDSWGIGVVVYFNVLKKMCIIFFIIGLLNIPNIWYFRENLNTEMELDIFTFITFGTAICDDFEWVECENCADKPEFKNDLGASVIGNDNITRYRRYNCEAVSLLTGSISLATLFTLLLGFLYLVSSITKREGTADTSKISSSDYSIMIMNPPPDAYDPDDWRDFFSTFDEHKPPLVTVALNNHTLIEATVQLRIVQKKLQSMLPSVDLKDKEALACAVKKSREKRKTTKIQMFLRFLLRPFGLWLYEEDLLSKYDNLMEKVKHLQSLNYKVMRVFVTMETEQGQRAALEALDVMAMNKVEKFQNTVLRVKEAREPTAIRWNDLHYNRQWKLLFRTTTLLLTFAIIGLQGYAVWVVTKKFEQVVWAAFTVKLGNIIFPQLLILFTNYEGHWSEGSRQLSIYFKITLFRWINTVFIILLLAPRTRILSGEIVESIGPILLFEIFFSPIIKYLDIVGNIKKHILAPRAHDQARMNSYFRGTVYNLAERYTDMTKMVVLCMTFSAIYPSIFLIGFIALLVQLISDKYCLLRIWSHSSDIGPQVSRFSRVYVLPSAIVIFVVSTTYFSQGFPFDHLCSTEVDGIYQYCDQSYSIFNPYPPKLLKNAFGWMTEMQITVATVSSWVTFLILILFGLLILYDRFGSWSKYFFKNRTLGNLNDDDVEFSTQFKRTDIIAYVPREMHPGLLFPCFSCDVSTLDPDLVGWLESADYKYDSYNLVNEVPSVVDRPIYSIVSFYDRFKGRHVVLT